MRVLNLFPQIFHIFFPLSANRKAEQMTTTFQLLNNKVEIFPPPLFTLALLLGRD